jgi:putative ABC transport system ATP-binding protein
MKIIELKDIKKTYLNGDIYVDALKNINLNISKGEYVSIMGPSGSGKSTLMNLIGGLDTASSGHYILNKKDISSLGDEEMAMIRNKEIGFVFQTFNLLQQYNAIDNVALPLIYAGYDKVTRTQMSIEALDKVGLKDRMKHKPNEMSGGQRQRVAIARALVNNPSIILADEPTGNLDSKTSIDIMNLMNDLHQKGNTIVLVTHEPDISEYAERIIHLKDGEIEKDLKNKKKDL